MSAPLTIAFVCDFFFPAVGGVENHLYQLASALLKRGHHVIIITHQPARVAGQGASLRRIDRYPYVDGLEAGVEWVEPGIKVYRVPLLTIARNASLPNYLAFLPAFRRIALRERPDIIHGHAALSSMAHEAILHAPLLPFRTRTIFTDHSLFPFDDAAAILTNKLLEIALTDVDAAICVSHAGRANTCLRASLQPHRISVIPNALIPSQFLPLQGQPPTGSHTNNLILPHFLGPSPATSQRPSQRSTKPITIVVLSRLAYRKGTSLLAALLPHVLAAHPEVSFLIGGDGPDRVLLEQTLEQHGLYERVRLLGAVPMGGQRDVLVQGQIFLSTSLTEAFGISILEAACAGLHIVSTAVGGVPEVLPADLVDFASPTVSDLLRAITRALSHVRSDSYRPEEVHERVKGMYTWDAIAGRTEAVYGRALMTTEKTFVERLERHLQTGPIVGWIVLCILVVARIFFWFLDIVDPISPHEIGSALRWSGGDEKAREKEEGEEGRRMLEELRRQCMFL